MPSNKNDSNSPDALAENIRRNMLSDSPLVAIVILNWNGRNHLEKFLPSVLRSTYENKKIIIADNASTDDSIDFLKKHYPSIQTIILPDNFGFAKGYNLALKQVSADYYVLLNSDVEVMPDWIESIIDLMEADATIGACQPKILSFSHPTQFEYAGACGGWIDRLGYPFARGRVFDDCEVDNGQYNNVAACFWATGASLFVKSAVFHELQGFDEYFFAHQEEIDFCWRLQMAGYTVYVQPASVVYHVGGGTLPKGNSLKTFLNFRNNLVMLYKNLPRTTVYFIIPVRVILDAVAAWKALFGGDSGYFIAVAKAHLYFASWILFNQKQSVFPAKRQPVFIGRFKGSVVWQHFVNKKKTFQQIVANK